MPSATDGITANHLRYSPASFVDAGVRFSSLAKPTRKAHSAESLNRRFGNLTGYSYSQTTLTEGFIVITFSFTKSINYFDQIAKIKDIYSCTDNLINSLSTKSEQILGTDRPLGASNATALK